MGGSSEADAPGACGVLVPCVCSWGFPGLLLCHDGFGLTGFSAWGFWSLGASFFLWIVWIFSVWGAGYHDGWGSTCGVCLWGICLWIGFFF